MSEIKQLTFADGADVTPPTASDADVQKTVFDDASTWDGSTYTKTYDLSDLSSFTVDTNNIKDASKAEWTMLDPSNNYEDLKPYWEAPSSTTVKFVFDQGYPPASGTFRIVGIG